MLPSVHPNMGSNASAPGVAYPWNRNPGTGAVGYNPMTAPGTNATGLKNVNMMSIPSNTQVPGIGQVTSHGQVVYPPGSIPQRVGVAIPGMSPGMGAANLQTQSALQSSAPGVNPSQAPHINPANTPITTAINNNTAFPNTNTNTVNVSSMSNAVRYNPVPAKQGVPGASLSMPGGSVGGTVGTGTSTINRANTVPVTGSTNTNINNAK